jgi:hypothetical protein
VRCCRTRHPGLGGGCKTSLKEPNRNRLAPGRPVAGVRPGSFLRIDRPIRLVRSFDIKTITMMRSGWEQTARRPRITRRWWAPPGTHDEENQPP